MVVARRMAIGQAQSEVWKRAKGQSQNNRYPMNDSRAREKQCPGRRPRSGFGSVRSQTRTPGRRSEITQLVMPRLELFLIAKKLHRPPWYDQWELVVLGVHWLTNL